MLTNVFHIQEKGAIEGGKIPNCTGAESVHAVMKACAMKKKVGLIEACEMDQNRAVSQIAAYNGYLEGVNRGRGPTIFELAFQSADKIGSTVQFEEASNLLLSSIQGYDLLRSVPLNGDLRTTSKKRKGLASDICSPVDSHRPDKVLITSAHTRSASKRGLFSPRFQASTSNPPQQVIDLSESEQQHQIPPVEDGPCSPAWRSISPIRALTPNQTIESRVSHGMWHIKRCTTRGSGPECYGTLGKNADRGECRCFVRQEGIRNQRGTACICIQWRRTVFGGAEIPAVLWFCPNSSCFRSKGRRGISNLPDRPQFLPIAQGTKLSQEEISHFEQVGLLAYSESQGKGIQVSSLELRIDVNLFQERIDMRNPDIPSKTRDGLKCRRKKHLTTKNIERIRLSEKEQMRVLSVKNVTTGNGWGRQYLIETHLQVQSRPCKYWVQICCFPCCSCPDFYGRHTYRQPFMTCKHLYWVYKNAFGVDIRDDSLVHQAILSLTDVQAFMKRDSFSIK